MNLCESFSLMWKWLARGDVHAAFEKEVACGCVETDEDKSCRTASLQPWCAGDRWRLAAMAFPN